MLAADFLLEHPKFGGRRDEEEIIVIRGVIGIEIGNNTLNANASKSTSKSGSA